MALIWLAEIDAGVIGPPQSEITLRVASAPYGYNHASAPRLYLPYLQDVANIRRSLVAPSRTFGEVQLDTGTMTVQNTDGELDEWFDYAYGRSARILLGDHMAAYSSFQPVISGRIDQASGDRSTITFRFQDRTKELDRLVSPAVYAGTNSGTSGHEGIPQDIGGQHKIMILGKPRNISPDPVNVNNNIYAVSHDQSGALTAVSEFSEIRLNGSVWTITGDNPDLATLEAQVVINGNVQTCLAGGALKRGGGSNVTGALTLDVVGSATAAENNIAAIATRLIKAAGVASSDIDAGTLASDAPWEVGMVIRDETSRDALNALLAQSGIWYAPNQQGIYQLRLVTPPGGTPVATFKPFNFPAVAAIGEYQIETLEPELSSVKELSTPAWRVTVNYDKRFVVQSKDSLADAIGEAAKEYYSREYSAVVQENQTIRDFYPDAQELTFNTLITNQTHATALATHLFGLYSVPRQIYRLTAHYDDALVTAVDLGDVVKLIHPRFGLANGKLGRVISMLFNSRTAVLEMEVWT